MKSPSTSCASPGGAADDWRPTVRNGYLVVDAVLLVFAGVLVVEAWRLHGWSRRLGQARHQHLALVPSVALDALLPLSILFALPLCWISTMGITPAFDVLGTWAHAMWTVPDIGASLIVTSAGLLMVGVVKAWQLWSHRRNEAREPATRRVHAAAGAP